MSRELERRISALERVKNGRGVEYVVLDYAPDDDELEPYGLHPPMTEAERVKAHCEGSSIGLP